MPRVDIPVQALTPNSQFVGTETASDDTNDHAMTNDGHTILLAVNRAASVPVVLIVSVADAYGRTGDISQALTGTTVRVFGPFTPKRNWNQTDGKVNIDVTGTDTDVFFTALSI